MKRLRRLLNKFRFYWPVFGGAIECEVALDLCADKVIERVAKATALGGDENLKAEVKEDLRQVFLHGGEQRIKNIHRRIRDLDWDILHGRI